MTPRPACPPRAIRMAMAVSLACAALGAQAMSVSYQCPGRRVLTAELEPRIGQLHFEGQDWTLRRVPARHMARYVNKRADIHVTARNRELSFTRGAETLQCFLYSDALPGDAPRPSN